MHVATYYFIGLCQTRSTRGIDTLAINEASVKAPFHGGVRLMRRCGASCNGFVAEPFKAGWRRDDLAWTLRPPKKSAPSQKLRFLPTPNHSAACAEACPCTVKKLADFGCCGNSTRVSVIRAKRAGLPRITSPSCVLGIGLRAKGTASAAV